MRIPSQQIYLIQVLYNSHIYFNNYILIVFNKKYQVYNLIIFAIQILFILIYIDLL